MEKGTVKYNKTGNYGLYCFRPLLKQVYKMVVGSTVQRERSTH